MRAHFRPRVISTPALHRPPLQDARSRLPPDAANSQRTSACTASTMASEDLIEVVEITPSWPTSPEIGRNQAKIKHLISQAPPQFVTPEKRLCVGGIRQAPERRSGRADEHPASQPLPTNFECPADGSKTRTKLANLFASLGQREPNSTRLGTIRPDLAQSGEKLARFLRDGGRRPEITPTITPGVMFELIGVLSQAIAVRLCCSGHPPRSAVEHLFSKYCAFSRGSRLNGGGVCVCVRLPATQGYG